MNVCTAVMVSLLAIVNVAGCQNMSAKSDAGEALTLCPEKRSPMCTKQYDPVCAVLADDSRVTFSNGCVACSHEAVSSWEKGACPE